MKKNPIYLILAITVLMLISVAQGSTERGANGVSEIDLLRLEGMTVKVTEPEVVAWIESFLSRKFKNPKTIKRVAGAIIDSSEEFGFDPLYLMALIQTESSFRYNVVGSIGEKGLMQIRPCTAKWINKKLGLGFKRINLFNVVTNIKLGSAYLHYLKGKFGNQDHHFTQAYNMGPTALRRSFNKGVFPVFYYKKVLGHYKSFISTKERDTRRGLQAAL